MSEKLQKFLAHRGLGSRREIETWIKEGRISVSKLGKKTLVSSYAIRDFVQTISGGEKGGPMDH